MAAIPLDSENVLGFLTVVDHRDYGLFGGYLLLNMSARPLEFHCTAPIKPNRAQQILYGATLDSFLYGEQIGRTLLERAKTKAAVICTDRQPMLAVREHVALPVALVLSADGPVGDQGGTAADLGLDHSGAGGLTVLEVGRSRLAVPEQPEGDRQLIVQRLARLPESFDLAEPFCRIREAIAEAQQAVRPALLPAA